MIKRHYDWFIALCYLMVGLFFVCFFDGTGDAGDSVYHYLIARYAPQHPELFFDHWGKPIFTLLASPFAQFGFVGIKFFNLIVASFCLFFTYRTAKLLLDNIAWMSPILLGLSTLFFTLTFSGLTEHLFALVSIWAIYLFLIKRLNWATILISLLPFIRSEGLVIMCIFVFILLLHSHWKKIPLLLVGHLLFSLAGYFVYYDLLWVFTKIPYASLESVYGSGNLFHFIVQLNYVIGLPNYILFWLGIAYLFYLVFSKKMSFKTFNIVLAIPIGFITAHSLFWYFGLFNSMGLIRVLIDVSPFLIIIALFGIQGILACFNQKTKKVIAVLIIVICFGFQFLPNHSAIHIRDLNLCKDQKGILQVEDYVKKEDLRFDRLIYNHPYVNVAFDIDPFNAELALPITLNNLQKATTKDLVLWDSWFALKSSSLNLKDIENLGFKELFSTHYQANNVEHSLKLFKQNDRKK